ncbi:PD-(D/E)XK nuclease family protein [Campylobacter sp. MG1]|uniref:PD-(D/E)XK nuclease family protein n=1 Tax=Campylobacter sp. MG1 TaxID=2976332 RepID=UPI00226C7992|nr:PD-(D/E)XK nuclease family protein [Campylobacter sp. MG1]
MVKKELVIFSNLRQIKEYIESLEDSRFFANTISINDFFNDFAISDCKKASEIEQIIAMSKACNKTKNYEKLKFSNDFLNFLKNKEYLFSFFAELNSEKVSINDLRLSDTYSFFDEYLDILEECFKNYKKELQNMNLYDEITLEKYKINKFLISQYYKITFYLNGFLKKYELEFFEEISKFCEVMIIINVSEFNKSLMKKSFKLDLLINQTYTLIYKDNSWQILKNTPLKYNDYINTVSFSSPIYQYIYTLHLLSKFYADGKNIAVVLPDESVSSALKALDIKNYLNIASGIKNNEVSQKLNAILCDEKYENSINKIQEKILKTGDIKLNFSDFSKFKEQILSLSNNDEVKEILNNRLFDIEILNKEFNLSPSDIITLLDVENIKVSHTDGGSVSVVGLLETRGQKFDLVIVLDFNDDLVPKRSVSEMFLNNVVRKKAGMISYEDRENLQRHYYKELFNCENVYVLYLENEEKSPARFLKDYKTNHISVDKVGLLNSYLQIDKNSILPNDNLLELDDEKIKNHNFFDEELSYSRLSTYENSSYEYYLKYIEKLKEPKSLKSMNAADVGSMIHKFLELSSFDDLNKFKKDFEDNFINILSPIEFALIYDNLDTIFYTIKDCCASAKCEAKITRTIGDINLIGYVDRLGDNYLIDYKNKNKTSDTKNNEKQLAFYNYILNDTNKKAILLYLKSTQGVKLEVKDIDKYIEKIEEEIADIKQNDFIKNNPEKAYGYFYLIINKKDKKEFK